MGNNGDKDRESIVEAGPKEYEAKRCCGASKMEGHLEESEGNVTREKSKPRRGNDNGATGFVQKA